MILACGFFIANGPSTPAWSDAVQWAPTLVEPDTRGVIRRVDRPMTSADTARQHMASAAFAHLSQDDTWSAVGQSLADLLVGHR